MSSPVLLLQPFPYLSKVAQHYSNRLPLGLLYLGESLRGHGIAVEVLDLSIVSTDFDLQSYLSNLSPVIVGISVHSTPIAPLAFKLASVIRHTLPGCVLVAGGVHPSVLPHHVLESEFDIVVIGEGEGTFVNLVSALQNGGDLHKVAGIAFKSGGTIIHTGPGPVIDMDRLPTMPSSLIDLDAYELAVPFMPPGKTLNLMTSRGCPHRCAYCAYKAVSPTNVRFRSPHVLANELETICDTHGISNFYFMDDDFALKPSRLWALFDLLHSRGLEIHWRCQGRSDSFMREPSLLTAMAAAGCNHLSFGIETADEVVLSRVNKQLDLQTARKAIRLARSLGIRVRVFLMVGLPYQTMRSIEKTIDFLAQTRPDEVSVEPLVPYPGSPIYYNMEAWGIRPVDDDFTHHLHRLDWFDLAMAEAGAEPIIETKWMSKEQIVEARRRILEAFAVISGASSYLPLSETYSIAPSGSYLKYLLLGHAR